MFKRFLVIFSFITIFLGCKSEYTKAVESGLASGIKKDSLIFGMKMGMTKDDFFRICWDLNKAKIISEGPGNNSAKYNEPLTDGMDTLRRKQMLFYGIFDEKKVMHGMDMTYTYFAWSPWNKNLSSTELAKDLMKFYEKHYPGNAFIEIDLGLKDYKAYAKIDGSTQITIYPKTEKDVAVKIEDLHYKLNQKK
jgi:hypothetical protein